MPGQGQHKNANANNCHPNSDDTKGSNKTLQEVQQTLGIDVNNSIIESLT